MALKFGTSGVRGLVLDMSDAECYGIVAACCVEVYIFSFPFRTAFKTLPAPEL